MGKLDTVVNNSAKTMGALRLPLYLDYSRFWPKTEKTIVSTVLVLYTATLIQDNNVPESFWKLI